jgi:hypothetical protein
VRGELLTQTGLNALCSSGVPVRVRATPLLLLLLACDPPPAMRSDPEELWFRSRGVVSSATALQVVQEAAGHENSWAGPLYVLSPPASRGKHLLGHQKLFLREYEPAPGRFRAVDAADDRTMACATLRRTLELLSDWNRRFGTAWDVQLGPMQERVPGRAGSIDRNACSDLAPTELAAIDRRYPDRPR